MPKETSVRKPSPGAPMTWRKAFTLLPVGMGIYLGLMLVVPETFLSLLVTPLAVVSLSSLAALAALLLLSVASGRLLNKPAVFAGVLFAFSSGVLFFLGD